jgi:acyl-CoA synthetase (AMP-forming)/AMP-acid ligase II
MLRPVAMRKFVDALEAQPHDLGCLQVMAYGAAAAPRSLLERGRRLMPCQWVQGYGLSETYGPFCWLDEQGHREQRYRRSVYCVGRPDDTVELALHPVEGHPQPLGEVAVRSTAIMDGYYDLETNRVTAPGEWFPTGDVGEWSPDGDLLLKGRLSGSVLSANGHRIYPEEVEAALSEVPGVDEVAVIGATVEAAIAERPVACVQGPLAARPAEEVKKVITRSLRPVLSAEKWPDYLYLTARPFAKSANGKTRLADLRSSVASGDLIPFGVETVGSPA